MKANELNEKLVAAESALVEVSKEELEQLLDEIGYGGKAKELLLDYQDLIKKFREKIGEM